MLSLKTKDEIRWELAHVNQQLHHALKAACYMGPHNISQDLAIEELRRARNDLMEQLKDAKEDDYQI